MSTTEKTGKEKSNSQDHQSDSKYVISVGNYEGGLLGLSLNDFTDLENLNTEYAFSALEVRRQHLKYSQRTICL